MLRCKACGVAQRPLQARCRACDCLWEDCAQAKVKGPRARPLPTPARAGRGGCITFATDFSGMDMMAHAMDASIVADIPTRQLWACVVWREARGFIRNNHRPEEIHARVEERPFAGRCRHDLRGRTSVSALGQGR